MLLRILIVTGLAIAWMFVCFFILGLFSEEVAVTALVAGYIAMFRWFERGAYARLFGTREREDERKTRELERFYRDHC